MHRPFSETNLEDIITCVTGARLSRHVHLLGFMTLSQDDRNWRAEGMNWVSAPRYLQLCRRDDSVGCHPGTSLTNLAARTSGMHFALFDRRD
jgi:hypothetical protein